ncbi:hypothetical protein [Mucilaginibacter sp. SP1R1]|uniref:hypothetical protein n=1 Tax=Mucilaginibacter sp. SP1R1 TaxID=2723091 RepID=UPI00160FB10C|nr:hypothetical protein [Mucilaginibacter sp. SP1R1]MBB6149499.1 hypothetical protein [Mucilaginibacter sp. SP1R1]
MSENNKNNSELNTFGFITSKLRTGIITAFLAMQTIAIVVLFSRYSALQDKFQAKQDELYRMTIEYIRPSVQKINQAATKVDTISNKVDSLTTRLQKRKK